MPVTSIYSRNKNLTQPVLDQIATKWAKAIEVDVKDISITLVPEFMQAGRQYDMMVNLFLPSLWSTASVRKIQLALAKLLAEHGGVAPSEILIITEIIRSGNVVEDGSPVDWEPYR